MEMGLETRLVTLALLLQQMKLVILEEREDAILAVKLLLLLILEPIPVWEILLRLVNAICVEMETDR